jgi:hypothetical protein
MQRKKTLMASKQQMTGMRGVYLVAAELTRLGFVVSPTSRSAAGADLLVTDQRCKRAYSVQVKTNAKPANFWLVNPGAKHLASKSHVYVFVNIRKGDLRPEFFVVPSRAVARGVKVEQRPRSTWYSFWRDQAGKYQDRWSLFGTPT